MERVVARGHLLAARRRAKRNGGGAGLDGMTSKACKHEVRRLPQRTHGVSLRRVVSDRGRDLDGWYAYVGVTEAPSSVKGRDSGIRPRLRGDRWQSWGRHRSRERHRRGVSRDLAWNTLKSARAVTLTVCVYRVSIEVPHR
jgi:hypothetical protein